MFIAISTLCSYDNETFESCVCVCALFVYHSICKQNLNRSQSARSLCVVHIQVAFSVLIPPESDRRALCVWTRVLVIIWDVNVYKRAGESHMELLCHPIRTICVVLSRSVHTELQPAFFKRQHNVLSVTWWNAARSGDTTLGRDEGGFKFRTRKCFDESCRALGEVSPPLLLHLTFPASLNTSVPSWPPTPLPYPYSWRPS